MKKAVLVTLCLIALCIIGLLINVGTIKASEPGYTRIEYPTIVEPTIDGQWTSDDEWTDGDVTMINGNVAFRSTYSLLSFDPVTVTTNFVIEIFGDNTNDTGDYWQIISDGTVNGGATPQTDDFRIDVVGHTDVTVYQGDGAGWTQVTPAAGDLSFANSISASPQNSTPHWIAEFTILKTSGVIVMDAVWGLRVAVYDESSSTGGVQAWPPTDQDVPEGWGVNNYTDQPIPEGLTFAVMALLSSVSVLVGSHYLWKHSKKREKQ